MPRISELQLHILVWLARERRAGDNHQALVCALPYHKGNISHSLRTLERHGYLRLTRSSGGQVRRVELVGAGRRLGRLYAQTNWWGWGRGTIHPPEL